MTRVCSSRASFVSAVWRTSDNLTEFCIATIHERVCELLIRVIEWKAIMSENTQGMSDSYVKWEEVNLRALGDVLRSA